MTDRGWRGRLHQARERFDLVVVFLLFVLVMPAQLGEWFNLLETQTLGLRHLFRTRYGDPGMVRFVNDVVLIHTDEAFFKEYRGYPFRRVDIARIAHNLRALGARVVALDILMDFPSSYGEDPQTADLLSRAGHVLLVSHARYDRRGRFLGIHYPTPLLDQVAISGYTNIQSASTLTTTISRLTLRPELTRERHGWPFAIMAVAQYLGVEPRLEGHTLVLGERRIGLDADYNLYIDWSALPAGIRHLSDFAGMSALRVLDIDTLDEDEREELTAFVTDKLVLVGDTSLVSNDWLDTPVGTTYGVEILAQTMHTLLRGGALWVVPWPVQVLGAGVFMSILLLVGRLGYILQRLMATILLMVLFLALSTWIYVQWGAMVGVSYVVVAGGLSYLVIEWRHHLLERRMKQVISYMFGQYVPRELVTQMQESGQSFSVGGESRDMTVFFSDVRGFTTISESLPPTALSNLMNAFLTPVTQVVHKHHGTIDKYMGDAVMAFWGAPLVDDQHARHAVEAALEVQEVLQSLRATFQRRGWPVIAMGVGINSGIMHVGNMGSEFRLTYTVLGDAVNLGSRLEGLTHEYGVGVIISEFTASRIEGLHCRELDLVRVKGKQVPVRIFEPVGFTGRVAMPVLARLDRYHQALALYRQRQFAEAATLFTALRDEEPDRLLYHIYLKRMALFLTSPPDEAWDGVFTFTNK